MERTLSAAGCDAMDRSMIRYLARHVVDWFVFEPRVLS
jgi:hypothetical protein